ncbi:hypothetical protein H9P43_005543 [Blastocladiella emersonii ATCC 22665]|nr:hypothetical protein H9P43_005543 [Blastocladiella emersonii ATCC 22665]
MLYATFSASIPAAAKTDADASWALPPIHRPPTTCIADFDPTAFRPVPANPSFMASSSTGAVQPTLPQYHATGAFKVPQSPSSSAAMAFRSLPPTFSTSTAPTMAKLPAAVPIASVTIPTKTPKKMSLRNRQRIQDHNRRRRVKGKLAVKSMAKERDMYKKGAEYALAGLAFVGTFCLGRLLPL